MAHRDRAASPGPADEGRREPARRVLPGLRALAHAAEASLAKMAERDLLTSGLMIKTTGGNAIQNPLVGTANKAASDMVRYATEFGFTPAARSPHRRRLHDGNPQVKFAGLIGGLGGVKRTLHGRRRAARVIKFIEKLTVPSGTGQGKPFKLAPWQKTVHPGHLRAASDGRAARCAARSCRWRARTARPR